jgi:hypothetical protein
MMDDFLTARLRLYRDPATMSAATLDAVDPYRPPYFAQPHLRRADAFAPLYQQSLSERLARYREEAPLFAEPWRRRREQFAGFEWERLNQYRDFAPAGPTDGPGPNPYDPATLAKIADANAFNPPKSEQQMAVEDLLRAQGVDPTAWWQASLADSNVQESFRDPGVRSTGLDFFFLGPDNVAYVKDVPPDPWTAAIRDSWLRARIQAMAEGGELPPLAELLPYLLAGAGKSLPWAAINSWGMRGRPRTQALNDALVASFQRQFPEAIRLEGPYNLKTGKFKEFYHPPVGRELGYNGLKGGHFSEIVFEVNGKRVVIHSVSVDRHGKPTAREQAAAEALRRLGFDVLLVPKTQPLSETTKPSPWPMGYGKPR